MSCLNTTIKIKKELKGTTSQFVTTKRGEQTRNLSLINLPSRDHEKKCLA